MTTIAGSFRRRQLQPRSSIVRLRRLLDQVCAAANTTSDAVRRGHGTASGTVFESSKLPLPTWFLAMHLMTQAKNNVSALELERHLGVSYLHAWLLETSTQSPHCKA